MQRISDDYHYGGFPFFELTFLNFHYDSHLHWKYIRKKMWHILSFVLIQLVQLTLVSFLVDYILQ